MSTREPVPDSERYSELSERVTDLDARLSVKLVELAGKDEVRALEVETIRTNVELIRLALEDRVHVSRYVIVERIVFGLVALTLTGVFGALLGIVVTGQGG